MKIIVHRGTHQIGGCATEIKTNTSRILIDAGSELDSNTPLSIAGITSGTTNCNAVLFTHYHGDHIGLLESVNNDIPMYIGELSKRIIELQNFRQHSYDISRVQSIRTYKTAEPIYFGDIKVTPYMVDHSAFDSHMFLIEAEGKKILHTGDFRTHGFRGKGLIPTVEKYVGKVDLLICEGTTISRSNVASMTENALSTKAKTLFNDNKYVFIVCASTNIDRIAAFCSAVPRGKYCLCDSYQKSVLDEVVKTSGKHSSLYTFPKMMVYRDNLNEKMVQRGFCMFIRPGNRLSNKVLEKYKEYNPLVIYSMWSGYLDENQALKDLQKSYRMEILHTSGHADITALHSLIDTINPDKILPIHTTQPNSFPYTDRVISVNDKEGIII